MHAKKCFVLIRRVDSNNGQGTGDGQTVMDEQQWTNSHGRHIYEYCLLD